MGSGLMDWNDMGANAPEIDGRFVPIEIETGEKSAPIELEGSGSGQV